MSCLGTCMRNEIAAPLLEFVLELRVNIGSTLESGSHSSGSRRMVPISGGTFSGVISGRVLPGGADWQFIESNLLTFVDARYIIETDNGSRIEVRNQGVRHGPPEVIKRLSVGERVSPTEYYFRTNPKFYPSPGPYEWLKRSVFVGSGERLSDLVVVRVWKVL